MELTELYSTDKGKTYQNDLTNTIEIHFKEFNWNFSVSDFLIFRKNINAVEVKDFIFNLSDDFDFVSVNHVKLSSAVTLTLCDLIHLRDLLDGTRFALELVTVIYEVLGDYSVV